MDLEQTRTLELEQDDHDPEDSEDRNRKRTLGLWVARQTLQAFRLKEVKAI